MRKCARQVSRALDDASVFIPFDRSHASVNFLE